MTTGAMTAWKPRVINGLITVELPDGLLFEGAAQRQVLRGRHAVSLLPPLLAELDGTATIDEVAAALPAVAVDHVERAVSLLASLGLVEDASEESAGPRLNEAEVILVADDRTGRLLARQLDTLGIRDTTTAVHGALITRRLEQGPRPDLVVVVEQPLDRRSLGRLDRHCARAGVPWLRTAMNSAGGEIGPLFSPNGSPCYQCFLAQSTGTGRTPDRSVIGAWAALVAMEVSNILTGIAPSQPQVAVFDFDLWEDRRITVTCPYQPHQFPERR
jgi:hypothetical protein